MKKAIGFLALAMALCMALSACGGTTPASGTQSGGSPAASGNKSITIAQASEVANLNPTLYPRTPDTNVQCLIFDPLVGPLEDLSFEGILAKDWEISDDGTVYTFHLNEGVKWHDGEPFTAEDVAFTFNSLAHPNYVGGAESRVASIVGSEDVREGKADSISGIEVVDDNTIKFTLKNPDASFLGQLYMSILPKHILGDIDPGEWEKADFNRNPIGTGKYRFVKWESGQYIQLEKNNDYFSKQPQIETIYYRFGDTTTMTTALMNGEVDIVERIEPTEIDMLNGSDVAKAITYETMNMYYIGLNQQNEFLKELKVRQALSHALDKAKIVNTAYGEFAIPTDDLFPITHWSHNENVTTYPYDPAKAETLLQEAGFTKNASGTYERDGKPLKFTFDMVAGNPTQDKMAQLIQQAWKAIGVEVEIRTQDFATLAFTRLLPKDASGTPRANTPEDFDMYALGFGVEVDPDEYRNYFSSTGFPPNGMNFIQYSNPEIDRLFLESITQTNQEERVKIFHEIAQILSDDIPWIPLYNNIGIVGVGSRVQNYKVDFRGVTYQIAEWTV